MTASSSGGVGRIRLERPEKRNALTVAMRGALAEALAAFDADPEVRVVVLSGAGSAFCAGVDLAEDPGDHPLLADPVAAPLERFGKPVLAAVNGPAAGGGLELALAADLRVASSSATFSLPEVKIGSLAGSAGAARLLRAVPPTVAARMIYTGEPIDAAEALRVGLVSDLAEPDGLEALATGLAERVAAAAPLSLRAARLVLRSADDRAGGALERALWGLLALTDDRAEGRAAFRERRPPRFRGR